VQGQLQEEIPSQELKVADLPFATRALQRHLTTFLARHQIDLCNVRQIAGGYCIGPIVHPSIKAQLSNLKAKGRPCHLLSLMPLNSLGSCLVVIDTKLCEIARLHDFPSLYVAFAHYSQVPEIAQYLRSEVLGRMVEKRFGKEDLETHFRLFTGALGLQETPPDDLRVAGYYDRSYGYMAELYATPTEHAIEYLNLGPRHLIEHGHCSYALGPDVFALISFRKALHIGSRLMAIAWCRAAGHKNALRDLARWQRAYDNC
jgi:hypothetical protein